MKGRVVLVTGANGGLGNLGDPGVSRRRRDRHWHITKDTTVGFQQPGFTAMPAEISTREGAKALIDQVTARFGRLDVLAHTVGGFAGGQSIADTYDSTFQQMFDLNLNSVFHILRATIPALRKAGDRRIIAIGSRAALRTGSRSGRL
jgi:3-oxoacyl-[acyl-carrier protein] reductase